MKILEHNVDTGEVIERDATADEIAQAELDAALAAQEKADRLAAESAKESASQSAISKLEAIGLTVEEIAALRG